MNGTIEIDGAYGEGGGQVIRTSLTLATVTGRPVRIRRIRAGRKPPGLAPQHLTGVLALAEICKADVKGASIRSTEIVFEPKSPPRAGAYLFDVAHAAPAGSAGSVTLILQTILLPLALAESESHVTLKGGTHVPWSPPFDSITHAYLPAVSRMGVKATCSLEAWGFYPAGGGQVSALILGEDDAGGTPLVRDDAGSVDAAGGMEAPAGRRLAPLVLTERGPLRRVSCRAVACSLPSRIAQRMADRTRNLLGSKGISAEMEPRRVSGRGPGAGLFLLAEYEYARAAFSALGVRGKASERVAEEACRDLLAFNESDAPVDMHLADQLLLPMALALGRSEIRTCRITGHLLTNAHIIRQFCDVRISIEGKEGMSGTVVVEPA